MSHSTPRAARRFGTLALVGAIVLLCSSCLYFPAYRQLQRGSAGSLPWWCESNGSNTALTAEQCDEFSLQLDLIYDMAAQYPTVADAVAAGYVNQGGFDGTGTYFEKPGADTSTFALAAPQVLIYTGPNSTDRLAGVAHHLTQPDPPEGYPGDRDAWFSVTGGPSDTGATASGGAADWFLPMWFIRGFENHPDIFAPIHPCLQAGSNYSTTLATCYTTSHTEPLQIVVTNDDGIGAAGIDAVVEELRTVPGVTVQVVAPATNQSGTGDRKTPGGATGQVAQTASGYSGHSVNGTPADSVLYALNELKLTPDLVVSGTNFGANMGPVIPLSGTVGAARTAARLGIPAVAVSTGIGQSGTPTDFASSADAAAQWVEEFRLGLVGPPGTEVANINVPSCASGTSIRGTLNTAVATALDGRNYNGQNCASTVTTIGDDIDAMNHGYISRTDAKLN